MTRSAATDVTSFLEDALRAALPDDAIRLITVTAPAVDPEAVVAAPGGPAVFWSIPGSAVQAGLGAAAVIRAGGGGRFIRVRERAESLWARLHAFTHDDAAPVDARVFGGFAFLPDAADPEWDTFGDAAFLLPRWLYTVDGDSGPPRLTLAVTGSELERRGAAALVEEASAAATGRLVNSRSDAGERGLAPSPAASPADPESREGWRRAVASIQDRITAGRASKIVAARRRRVPVDAPVDVARLLRRLDTESATAARFLFRFEGAAFVGATPERLVGRRGHDVRTEALAGTVPAGSREREERLLASVKDSVEHQYVVRAIAEALGPVCETLDYPDEPRIQRLRHVVHLQTPFHGRLRDPVHVLELVERLHPTPAVGGLPREAAVEWIEGEEPGSRGWYAGPVGWFDAAGDGEFGVALRSGLLRESEAWLYAGAGIVRDSDADAEYDETEVKLRTMLDALGQAP